jgi:hypothetical protein
VRRTQLYLDDNLSELVREAVRAQYLGGREERMKAMQEFVGIRKEGSYCLNSVEYVRSLRLGERLGRLCKRRRFSSIPTS